MIECRTRSIWYLANHAASVWRKKNLFSIETSISLSFFLFSPLFSCSFYSLHSFYLHLLLYSLYDGKKAESHSHSWVHECVCDIYAKSRLHWERKVQLNWFWHITILKCIQFAEKTLNQFIEFSDKVLQIDFGCLFVML